ncbi:hypothetical protein D9M70_631510 [compost metagenome]
MEKLVALQHPVAGRHIGDALDEGVCPHRDDPHQALVERDRSRHAHLTVDDGVLCRRRLHSRPL